MRQFYTASLYVITLAAGIAGALQANWEEERIGPSHNPIRSAAVTSSISETTTHADAAAAAVPHAISNTTQGSQARRKQTHHPGWLNTFLRTAGAIWLTGIAMLCLFIQQARQWLFAQLRHLPSRPERGGGDRVPIADKKIGNSWIRDLHRAIGRRKVTIVANREPYIHQKRDGKIELLRPASGLVTALEPILRNCGGLWIAHGSGNADRETADEHGEIAVPPGNPSYRLKRIWLSEAEEQGYYYGFANEGLWPLCHLAHTRPNFRLSDWEHYRGVNQKFCDETPAEALEDDSLILVQDYHFALLPRMLRDRSRGLPRIGLFWHIPWPNPEAFGICPWSRELLHGMLGASVVSFHTQYHCNNFLETCDRYLEARVDWEKFSVTMGDRETLVRAFPIGIDTAPVRRISERERIALKERYGIHAPLVGVGVDRLDYTKGLIERAEAIERFLEKYPHYQGKFTFVQMGSPSRTHIPAYRSLGTQLDAIVERINARFGSGEYRPFVLLARHHEWSEIQFFYQLGDVCLVTSLHDGMNLVAKEYVWCQDPARGALVLSKFAGASRELQEAFIINPYSIEDMADAIANSLELETDERARRMSAMRSRIAERNAFHWASDLVRVLASEVRPENASSSRSSRPEPAGYRE